MFIFQRRTWHLAISFFLAIASTIAVAQTTLDLAPPVVSHSVPKKLKPGEDILLKAKITDDNGIKDALLYYRTTQTGQFKSTPLTEVSSDEYTTTISTTKETELIQYYFEVADVGGNLVLEGNPGAPLMVEAAQSNLVLIGLGALAIGAVLVAASSGGGGENESDNRNLEINLSVPE